MPEVVAAEGCPQALRWTVTESAAYFTENCEIFGSDFSKVREVVFDSGEDGLTWEDLAAQTSSLRTSASLRADLQFFPTGVKCMDEGVAAVARVAAPHDVNRDAAGSGVPKSGVGMCDLPPRLCDWVPSLSSWMQSLRVFLSPVNDVPSSFMHYMGQNSDQDHTSRSMDGTTMRITTHTCTRSTLGIKTGTTVLENRVIAKTNFGFVVRILRRYGGLFQIFIDDSCRLVQVARFALHYCCCTCARRHVRRAALAVRPSTISTLDDGEEVEMSTRRTPRSTARRSLAVMQLEVAGGTISQARLIQRRRYRSHRTRCVMVEYNPQTPGDCMFAVLS
eukprot:4435649-Amphidinium_carterae.3